MKAAILIHSDPKTGTEEALGRVFNALSVAYDLKQTGHEARVLFLGTGTRWVAELTKPENPVHGLFDAVKDKVEGVSRACADVFGATDDVHNLGYDFVSDNAVPDTTGLPSIAKLMADGYSVLVY